MFGRLSKKELLSCHVEINTAGQKALIFFSFKYEFVLFLEKIVCVFYCILFLRKDADAYATICTIVISSALKCSNNDLDYIELLTSFITAPNL